MHRTSEQCLAQIQELRVSAGKRENARVFFDHYRAKISKLEKTHAQAPNSLKQEKYQRNLRKYNEAKQRFEEAGEATGKLLDQVQAKMEFALNEVCFKFTQQVELRFYAEMNQVYSGLHNFEERMREIALQAATGEFGKVGNRAGLDLHVQF